MPCDQDNDRWAVSNLRKRMRTLNVTAVIAVSLILLVNAGSVDEAEITVESNVAINPENSASLNSAPVSQPAQADKTIPDSVENNEEPIIINWYEPDYRNVPFPNGSALDNYAYYKTFAEAGSGIAAYQLANLMRSCSGAFLTRAELDTAIAQMRRTFSYYDPEREATVRLGEPEKVEEFVESRIRHFENCNVFTAEQRQEHDMWMELASNNGHPLAMLEYGDKLDDPVAALELYRGAWHQGQGGALLSMATGLEKLYHQGIDPQAMIPAYAAMHAFVTLLQTAYGANPERVVGRWTIRNQAKLDQMARELLPHELETATEMARTLINTNKNCCYAM